MGGATWNADTYTARSAIYASQSRQELFSKRKMREDFDPAKITVRESCDSEQNPNSTPIIVGLDVTGSMGMIAEHIAKNGLGTLVESIHDRKPVSDPHIMMMAVGDIEYDSAPLQVTQFEADIRIAEQLTDLYLEGGGGGNSYESYDLPWLFASTKTKIDSYDKRGVKGYLFTIGDELPPRMGTKRKLNERIGADLQAEITTDEALAGAQEKYHVFHLIVEEGSFARRNINSVVRPWTELLGKHAICLNDYEKISEVITSVIEVNEGAEPQEVIAQWQDKRTRDAVEHALYGSSGQ